MKKENLKEIFKKAASIASEVPENMQSVAFSRALEILLGEAPEVKAKTGTRRKKGVSAKKQKEKIEDTSVQRILNELDRTKYPIMEKLDSDLERSLLILKIAREEFDIDGLNPSQIAKILVDKFRVPTYRQNVYKYISKASKFVDRIPAGQANKYRIMQPGEEYLAKIIAEKEKK